MQSTPSTHIFSHVILPIIGVLAVGAGAIGYSEYRYRQLEKTLTADNTELASSTLALEQKIQNINDQVALIVNDNTSLSNVVQSVQANSSAVQDQIGQIYSTADTLNKLSKVDPQLLQKYSKVYFLNENYVPSKLTTIPPQYTYAKSGNYKYLEPAYPFLQKMLDSAKADGVTIQVISAYRSFGTQEALKKSYQVTYGAGTANQFSADQGYSEHQLGTAVDFTSPKVADTFTNFDKDPAYTWLVANAYKYGFILSYPPNNKYYQYEPWHWRFVGITLATKLHTDNKYFYDMDQRTINDYLQLFFDPN